LSHHELLHLELSSEASALAKKATRAFKEDHLVLAHEIVRMLKLFYFCLVEHLRSTEGTPAWALAHDKAQEYATPFERDELLSEFGPAQPNAVRRPVEHTFHFRRFNAEDDVTLHVRQDPTRAKPLVVLAWVRMTLERGVSEGLLRDTQLTSFSAGMTKLVEALGGMHKVDTMVLPFPYAQLLRWSLLIFCFSLPFVMVTEFDWFTIPLCMFTTCVVSLCHSNSGGAYLPSRNLLCPRFLPSWFLPSCLLAFLPSCLLVSRSDFKPWCGSFTDSTRWAPSWSSPLASIQTTSHSYGWATLLARISMCSCAPPTRSECTCGTRAGRAAQAARAARAARAVHAADGPEGSRRSQSLSHQQSTSPFRSISFPKDVRCSRTVGRYGFTVVSSKFESHSIIDR
jgi:hypothetical protein